MLDAVLRKWFVAAFLCTLHCHFVCCLVEVKQGYGFPLIHKNDITVYRMYSFENFKNGSGIVVQCFKILSNSRGIYDLILVMYACHKKEGQVFNLN